MIDVRQPRGWGRSALLLLVAGAICLAGLVPAMAEEEEEGAGFMAAKGRVTFRTYCASCHGSDARGEGNLAQYLSVAPADLTRIAERRDGEFPREEIAEIIDGRRVTKGHGTREMPVWGDVFQSPLSDTEAGPTEEPEERAARKVRELVLFLESIQVGASPVDQG